LASKILASALGQCYDHKFGWLGPIFCKKIVDYSENLFNDNFLLQNIYILNPSRQFLRRY
jgi:hypothetical protein